MSTTMTASQEVNRYVKSVTDLIPEDSLLGSVLYYSIINADVNLEVARQDLKGLGLDTRFLRKRLRPVDAFHKAARDLGRKFPVRDDGIQSSFIVPSVGQDKDTVHRHVVLERAHVATSQRRRVVYDTVAELIFWRGDLTDEGYEGYRLEINRKNVPGLEFSSQEEAWLNSMLGGLTDRFRHYRENLDSHAVRTYVRDYVTALSATCIKQNGGLYFVPQKHAAVLESLRSWVTSISDECEFHTMPLVDLDDQRDMLRKALEDEVVTEVERMSADIAKILKDSNRNITDKTFSAMNEEVSELLAKTNEYAGMLDRKLETANERLGILRKQVLQLVDRVQ